MWVGPMFSNKTSMLLACIEGFQKAGKSVLAIKYHEDKRYETTEERMIISHHGRKCGAIEMKDELYIDKRLADRNDVIAIDEGHFFSNLAAFCIEMRAYGKVVLVAGLDKDSNMDNWEPTAALKPHCDDFHLMTSICKYCGNVAPYTRKVDGYDKTKRKDIGGESKYVPVCSQHIRSTAKE